MRRVNRVNVLQERERVPVVLVVPAELVMLMMPLLWMSRRPYNVMLSCVVVDIVPLAMP